MAERKRPTQTNEIITRPCTLPQNPPILLSLVHLITKEPNPGWARSSDPAARNIILTSVYKYDVRHHRIDDHECPDDPVLTLDGTGDADDRCGPQTIVEAIMPALETIIIAPAEQLCT